MNHDKAPSIPGLFCSMYLYLLTYKLYNIDGASSYDIQSSMIFRRIKLSATPLESSQTNKMINTSFWIQLAEKNSQK